MAFALMDNDLGIDGLLGLVTFQPMAAFFISGASICMCLLAGLPIRLHKKLNHWWRTHFYVSIVGTATGLTCLFLTVLPIYRVTVNYLLDAEPSLKSIPHPTLSLAGWFLTAFSLSHLYLPTQAIQRVKKHLKTLPIFRMIGFDKP